MSTTRFVAALVCSVLAGCISVVEVKKFTGTEKGLRYALPDAYILVTPQIDGSATYEWVFLPNLDNEYVVQASAFVSKFTLDMILENGMLKSVSTKAENAAVAAKAVEILGNVDAARKDAAVAAAKTKADKVAAAQKDVAAAQIEVDVATARLKVLNDAGASEADKLSARVDVAKAVAKRDGLSGTADRLAGAGNVPGASPAALGQAWGPVLLRVMPDGAGVKLVPVHLQERFDTTKPPPVKPKPAAKPDLSFKNTKSDKKETLITILIDPPVSSVEPAIDLVRGTQVANDAKCSPALAADKKSVVVSCKPVLKAGDYVLQLGYKVTSTDAGPTSDKVSFTVK